MTDPDIEQFCERWFWAFLLASAGIIAWMFLL